MSLNPTADTKYIKLFSSIEFSENTHMTRYNLTEFPTNPKIGMDCMVKGMVYSYTQLDGYEFWMPLGVMRAIREVKVNMDSTENPNVIDLDKGNLYLKTITENTTLSVTNITTIQNTVNTFILELTNGGNFTVSWWGNIKWGDGKAPELTKDGTDILGFYTHDGVNWRGVLLSKDIK